MLSPRGQRGLEAKIQWILSPRCRLAVDSVDFVDSTGDRIEVDFVVSVDKALEPTTNLQNFEVISLRQLCRCSTIGDKLAISMAIVAV